MPFDNPYFPQQFDVGTPGAGHIHFAQDGSLTLFGADGVTVEASLDPVNGLQVSKGTITGALFRTAAAGNRIEITGTFGNRISFFSGDAGEVAVGQLNVNALTASGNVFTQVVLMPPQLNGAHVPELILNGGASSGFVPPSMSIRDELGHVWLNVDQTAGSGSLSFNGSKLTAAGLECLVYQVNGSVSTANLTLTPGGQAAIFFAGMAADGPAQSIYVKSDGHLYYRDSASTVHLVA